MQKHHFANHYHCFRTNYSCGLCHHRTQIMTALICSKGRLARPLYLHEQACLCRLNNLIPKIDRVKVVKFSYDGYPVPFPWDVRRCWLLTIYTNHMGPVVRNRVSDRSWKTWKVMEFRNFIFQAWKVMEFNCQSWKVMLK